MSALPNSPLTVSLALTERSKRHRRIPRFLRRPGGIFGAGWIALLVVLSLTSALWRPDNPNTQNLTSRLQGPSAAHWLGTDELGRDVLTRIFTASWPALAGAGIATAVSLLIAIPLVLFAAERQSALEWTVSRGAEVFLALPGTVILLAVVNVLGGGNQTYVIMAVLGLLGWAPVYRVLLDAALQLHKPLYIDAARVDGVSAVRVGFRYVLPGLGRLIAVQASLGFSAAILVGAALGFMGFGPSEPTASWGTMIASASQYIYQQPWLMVPTGVILALTVIAGNALASALAPEDRVRVRGRNRKPHPEARQNLTSPTVAAATGDAEHTGRDPHPPLLDVHGLTLRLEDGPTLVSDVSLKVQAGRVLGLIGESGCGKSVTALALLRLLPPDVLITGGSIRLEGQDISTLTDRQLRPMRGRDFAMILQDPMVALDPLFTIESLLCEPIRRIHTVGRAEARRIALDLLTKVEIPHPELVLRQRPYELSGGMAQRVTIALALSGQPRLLVADEPTTALDVTVQMEILDLLARLVRETGVGLLIVSHDMGVIADICDDVAVMYSGQIVEEGAVTNVLEEARHPYTLALLAANPHVPTDAEVPERLAVIPGRVVRPGDWPQGCRFASRCPFATGACEVAIELEKEPDGASVRCIRADEIRRGQVEPAFAPFVEAEAVS